MHEQTFDKPLREETAPKPRPRIHFSRRYASWLTLAAVLALWQMITWLKVYPDFIIPPPLAVLEKFGEVIADGRLWLHTSATLVEVLAALAVGLSVGVLLGYILARLPFLEEALSPLIVTLQSMPVVAYAPLLVIWFGSGPTSKIVTGALIVFFPILVNTIVGVRSVPLHLRDLMRSMQATRWQMFTKLEVPAALPVLLSGMKISATLAVIGAVVGEFVSANVGLGVLITQARGKYDTPLVVVVVLMLTIIARTLYGLVSLIERRALAWQTRARR